jgi:hypothetical protein
MMEHMNCIESLFISLYQRHIFFNSWTVACLKTTHCSNCCIIFNWSRRVLITEGLHSLPAMLIHPWWRKQPQGTWDMYSYTCHFFIPTVDRFMCVCVYIYIYKYILIFWRYQGVSLKMKMNFCSRCMYAVK